MGPRGRAHWWSISWISTDRGVISLLREPHTRGCCSFMDLGARGRERGRTRSGKGLSLSGGKCVQGSPLLPPDTDVSWEAPEDEKKASE